jgi:membrane associated rhomboid family serine protease
MFPLRDSVPSRRFPFVNYAFIIVNVVVFLQEVAASASGGLGRLIAQWGLVPSVFFHDPATHAVTVFTAMFLHGGWMHLIGNMWFLFVFGDNVEDNVGHVRYFFYYLLCGAGAAACQLWANPLSRLPMVGASGAIAGVLGGYFVLHPRARITSAVWFFFFLRIVELPAFVYLGLWFAIQAINGWGSFNVATRGDVGGVAWWAHLGGFAAGFILILIFRTGRKRSAV